jgi:hypothetical protein
LAVTNSAMVTQAIGGLGGIGKTQLAARYVQLHANEYEIVAWIGAEDDGVGDLSQLAAKLGAPAAELSPRDRAQLALDWLGETDRSWLLVLDNIDGPEQLARLRPPGRTGQVLVTSRDRALRQFGPVLTLDVFDENTATRYLTERTGRRADQVAARELARAWAVAARALACGRLLPGRHAVRRLPGAAQRAVRTRAGHLRAAAQHSGACAGARASRYAQHAQQPRQRLLGCGRIEDAIAIYEPLLSTRSVS